MGIKNAVLFIVGLLVSAVSGNLFAWEIITDENAPYTYEKANWVAGNYIQSLFQSPIDLPALSENYLGARGKVKIPTVRWDDIQYPANTGLDILSFVEEAYFTPIVRLDLIKRIFKAMYKSHFPDAPAIYLTYNTTTRYLHYVTPCSEFPQFGYPSTRLLAWCIPDTGPEKLAVIYPRCKVSGKWYEDSDFNYADTKNREYSENIVTSVRTYKKDTQPEITITSKGWRGTQDKLLEFTVESPKFDGREEVQFVLDNFTDDNMGFYAPFPTMLPDTVQLPDKSEISSKKIDIENPSFKYLIVYTKDSAKMGNAYQNCMAFMWEGQVSSVQVDYKNNTYKKVRINFAGKDDVAGKVWLFRLQGIDPSLPLSHVHKICNNMLAGGTVGMPNYTPIETGWMEEPVSGLAGAAFIICKHDKEEDSFGGDDYADTARQIATQLVDDRISMWNRGRKAKDFHEYVTGSYFLTLLYDLPGRFNNPEKRDYYKKWVKTFADELQNCPAASSRIMMCLQRAYEITGNDNYSDYYDVLRQDYVCDETDGLSIKGVWKSPKDFYAYGDFLGALGRRGQKEDVADIERLIKFLTNQKRWTDNGYMGVFTEVTVENHNFFGRWCKGLKMESFQKRIVSVNDFPSYTIKKIDYNRDADIKMNNIPPVYNPDYWDQEVMKTCLPVLPHRLVKSVLFRIDAVFLKNDYKNDFWTGTKVPEAIVKINDLKSKMLEVQKYVDDKTAMNENYDKTITLLNESEKVCNETVNILEKTDYKNEEMIFCSYNITHLRNLLTKK
jgi:hypothetical protein